MKRVEKWEKGREGRERRKKKLGRMPVTRYRKRRWDNACHVPSTFAQKATMFEPLRKKLKKCEKNKKNAHLSRANTGSSPQTDQNGTTTGPEAKGARHCPKNEQNATKPHHHCPEIRENTTNHSKNDKLMSKIRKIATKTWQTLQFDVHN